MRHPKRKRIITGDTGRRYLIRGDWTAEEIRGHYRAMIRKYQTGISFDRYLVAYGKVYFEVPPNKQGKGKEKANGKTGAGRA